MLQINNENMNYELMREAILLASTYTKRELEDMLREEYQEETITDKVVNTVLIEYNLTKDQILSKNRSRNLVEARHMAMHMVRKHCYHLRLVEMRDYFKRDHSSVIHGDRKTEDRLFYDDFREKYERVDHKVSQIMKDFA